jgi:hypothetical protein
MKSTGKSMGYVMIQQTGDICQGDYHTDDNQTHLFPHESDDNPTHVADKTNPHIEWINVVRRKGNTEKK